MSYNIQPLAQWIHQCGLLSAAEQIETRRCLLDTLACVVAGIVENAADQLTTLLESDKTPVRPITNIIECFE